MNGHMEYKEMECKLFENMNQVDFVSYLVNMFTHEHIKNNTGIPQTLKMGKRIRQEIELMPKPGIVVRNGSEYCSSIMRIYNNDYWLIKLWLKMYVDAKDFEISRELVRSFIKHCILTTTQELVDYGALVIDKDCVVAKRLSGKSDYYRKIFNTKYIVLGMRQQQRDTLISRCNKNKWDQNCDFEVSDEVWLSLNDILNRNELAEYTRLVDICHEYRGDRGINGVFKSMLLFFRTCKGNSAIRKEMLRVL